MTREIPYPSPGEILLEEFLKPMGITQYRLAKETFARRAQDRMAETTCPRAFASAQLQH